MKDYSDLQWRDRSGIAPDSCRTIALSCELLHPAGRRVNPPARPWLSVLVRRRDVENDLELEQRSSGRHRLLLLTRVCFPGRTVAPRRECLFALPLGDDEVAVLALDGAQKLESEEAGGVLHGVRARREALLEFGARASGISIALIFTTAMRARLLR